MKRKCVVGSLSSIFTHSYIVGLINLGYKVDIINTSTKVACDNYRGCDVLNLNFKKNSGINSEAKSKLKLSKLFCYIYEVYLFFRAICWRDKRIDVFLKDKNVDAFIFFWGTSIRKEFYAIKKLYGSINKRPKYIIDVATYPIRDYATKSTPGFLLWFDKRFFNSFDTVLSHSSCMDTFLSNNISVKTNRIKRFICSFPRSSYYKKISVTASKEQKKIVFLGTLDNSSVINDITKDVIEFANSGFEIYVQENNNCKIDHPNVSFFKPFTFEEIIDGNLARFCAEFDAVLVSYGKMSLLREELTYPTRYAMALLQNIPIIIQKGRFKALQEIAALNANNMIVYYSSVREVKDINLNVTDALNIDSECMEDKLQVLF
ncbi:hypothetical protein ACX122_09390 [Kosakonia cowanii]